MKALGPGLGGFLREQDGAVVCVGIWDLRCPGIPCVRRQWARDAGQNGLEELTLLEEMEHWW